MPKRKNTVYVPFLIADAEGVTLSAKFAAALLGWSSTDATRASLCGIAADGKYLAATDGHRALRARLPDDAETPRRGVWARADVERELALAKAVKETTIRLDYAKLRDEHPPAFDAVFDFEADAPTPVFALNPDYLLDLAPVGKALDDGIGVEMRISVGDKFQPVRFSWFAGGKLPRAEGLIMQVRLAED
jgi:hypothetical protein